MFGEACLFLDASRREGNSARAPVGRIGRDAHEAGALELSNLSSYLGRMDVLRGRSPWDEYPEWQRRPGGDLTCSHPSFDAALDRARRWSRTARQPSSGHRPCWLSFRIESIVDRRNQFSAGSGASLVITFSIGFIAQPLAERSWGFQLGGVFVVWRLRCGAAGVSRRSRAVLRQAWRAPPVRAPLRCVQTAFVPRGARGFSTTRQER